MVTWSHSRISTFESCPYKYKLNYIDKVEVDTPTTIEAFMGGQVHATLEKLYKDKGFEKIIPLEELLEFYRTEWEKNYSANILVVKESQGYTAENYKALGEKYLTDYYKRHTPFNEMTIIDLETEEKFKLQEGYDYHIRIDKLGCVGSTYYICDYKTNSRMKDQEEADEDRQLAMYSLWVRKKFSDAQKVMLKWHMLKFDKDVISERTEEQLQKLREETLGKIKFIESVEDFPTKVSALCDYCIYKHLCPSFKHEFELAEMNIKDFKDDDGLKLVDEMAELSEKKRELEEKIEEIKEELVAFAMQKQIDKVYGSNKKASVKEYVKIIIKDSEKLEKLLKEAGLWDTVSSLNYYRLSNLVTNGTLKPGNIVDKQKDMRVSLSNK